jgi:hypothetical protein
MAAYKAGGKVDEDHDPAANQLQQDFAGAEPEAEAYIFFQTYADTLAMHTNKRYQARTALIDADTYLLGGDARPKDVADEGTRRWQSMEDTQKEVCIGI